MNRWMSAVAALGLLAAAGGAQETKVASGGGEAMPELPVAEWGRNGAVSLEDFRGLLTAVVFYDDNES
jgi:hypothetical protein